MHVNRISFIRQGSATQAEEPSSEPVQAILGAWRMNGQICGSEWSIVTDGAGYSTVALSPESDSLEARFNGTCVKTAIARAETRGLSVVSQSLGEDTESSPACSCATPSAYALFTTYVSLESPIRCMDCFRPVAVYRMKPMANGEFHELISWQSGCQTPWPCSTASKGI